MKNLPSIKEMLEAGLHFGHRTSHWHPKMEPYIFGAKSGIHIVDLEKTKEQMETAFGFLEGVVKRGGTVLFVGTKTQAKPIIREAAEACNMPFVTERWLGGTLTNFGQIRKTLKRFKKLKKQRDKGELRKYTKKERILIEREIEDMDHKIGGIQDLTSVPEAIFLVDARYEKTAIQEANRTGTKVVALCDTNTSPRGIDYVIPGNDDAVKSIELVTNLVKDVVLAGKKAGNQTKQVKKKKKASK